MSSPDLNERLGALKQARDEIRTMDKTYESLGLRSGATDAEVADVGNKAYAKWMSQQNQGLGYLELERARVEWKAVKEAVDSILVRRDQNYATLGLRPGATDAEVNAAYKALLKDQHPDPAQGNAYKAQQAASGDGTAAPGSGGADGANTASAKASPTNPAGGAGPKPFDPTNPEILSQGMRYVDRDIIVVQTSNGPQAFYRSTGRNSHMPGRWFPFDGLHEGGYHAGFGDVAPRGWFMKDRYAFDARGNLHSENDPLYRVGTEENRLLSEGIGKMDPSPAPNLQKGDGWKVNRWLRDTGAPYRSEWIDP